VPSSGSLARFADACGPREVGLPRLPSASNRYMLQAKGVGLLGLGTVPKRRCGGLHSNGWGSAGTPTILTIAAGVDGVDVVAGDRSPTCASLFMK
jgi:hypothetical protein